ncbi:Na+/H+ antiporter subunit E [Kocuria sp. cx-455]|uniref:Na+/H+ antiporter subunit E n=1 Tax=Kocuria sp. cx-455 TaxID=2771377 RepID=UPI0016850987|nr:Na+/H+ antiporter subunit E [Kocuria sp. cx-455]MBD2764079.1 Na+/H+ antiporter subunit E [Kocuria sp. cx-455]
MSTSPTQKRFQSTFRADIPLLLWLVVVWGALWGDWRLGNLVFGLILAFIVTRALSLPPIELSGRFNAIHFAVFVVSFIWQVATASFHVFRVALVQGPDVQNAVVGVKLRQNNDLLMTAVGHTMALIPGSLVIEVDRGSGILYFHVLDVANKKQAEIFRHSALRVEAAWIRIMGSKETLRALKQETQGNETTTTGMIHSPSTQMHRAGGESERGEE